MSKSDPAKKKPATKYKKRKASDAGVNKTAASPQKKHCDGINAADQSHAVPVLKPFAKGELVESSKCPSKQFVLFIPPLVLRAICSQVWILVSSQTYDVRFWGRVGTS